MSRYVTAVANKKTPKRAVFYSDILNAPANNISLTM